MGSCQYLGIGTESLRIHLITYSDRLRKDGQLKDRLYKLYCRLTYDSVPIRRLSSHTQSEVGQQLLEVEYGLLVGSFRYGRDQGTTEANYA